MAENNPQLDSVLSKYDEERDKRLRPDGLAQYIDIYSSESFHNFAIDPWDGQNMGDGSSLPTSLRDGDNRKILVVGAGFAGILFAIRLLQAGFSVDDITFVDPATGFGGTWYWQRFPGLMCDVESYIYLPLLEETGYMPTRKYASGEEIRKYAELLVDKWGLRLRAVFRTSVDNLTWDDTAKNWKVDISHTSGAGQASQPSTIQADFVYLATGLFCRPHIPKLPGIEKFQGHMFHTSRWDYSYTGGSPDDASLVKLRDKKVGIIGTGGTAIQVVPNLAKFSKELYVFQRTPSSVSRRDNRPTDPDYFDREVTENKKQGWHQERRTNFDSVISGEISTVDMISDEWSKMATYRALIGSPANLEPDFVAKLYALDLPRQESLRARVDEIINDKQTAERLKSWYPSWCKRPCFHDEYLPSFNLPNVKLIDTGGKGVHHFTERGVVVAEAGNGSDDNNDNKENTTEYDLDVVVLSTGYNIPGLSAPGSGVGIQVTGRGGKTLVQKWDEATATLHGIATHDFPNLFFPGISQAAASVNFLSLVDQLASHIAYILSESAKRVEGASSTGTGTGTGTNNDSNPRTRFTVEPTREAEEEWSMQIMSRAGAFAGSMSCTPSYMNGEGALNFLTHEQQMGFARRVLWGEGFISYMRTIKQWRDKGDLGGIQVSVVDSLPS